ncbi:MAG: hypothetical protein JZD40_01405 [Sulfolobus sp.]|nr:hypothetical protein [Sulfolobus sp.]
MYKKKIKKAIKDFFQYEKKDDNKILDKILDEFNPDLSKTEDDKFIAKVGNSEPILRSKNDVVGLFLANIPYYFTGKGELY